ncbi:uncharacterized protein LOC128872819 isoform X2 [Hylaeus volcanicus]|uniref:uncharacterized protein LOC128872819 isoform X2 n=1 Tax=Hylaeus volcanicus TaxID=313075 RepID=UPI0023B7BB07|nr:uncharacterized protein LOC128872819 isoform X2 [Hylaeus volcanicus]
MSGPGKSARPVRQLSLQPPAPRRKQIRRQRSAEDEKSLQVSSSSLVRGKRGTNGKPGSERPKVRVAWSENLPKNENLEQVEVVARQMPGRSRRATGRSRGFVGIEKPSILYTRQELAERLRLAWKHREENKANINIFLTHGVLEERCDSEMSSHVGIASPSSSLSKNEASKPEVPFDCRRTQDQQVEGSRIHKRSNGESVERRTEMENIVGGKAVDKDGDEVSSDFGYSISETREISMLEGNLPSGCGRGERVERTDVEETQIDRASRSSNVEYSSSSKKKLPTSSSTDCSNPRDSSTTLPSIKIENSTSAVTKTTRLDFSSAKEKRASFHSGANRAFLEPIKSPAEVKWISLADKALQQKLTTEVKSEKGSPIQTNLESKDSDRIIGAKSPSELKCGAEKIANQRTFVDDFRRSNSTIERGVRTKTGIESKDGLEEDKTIGQRTSSGNKTSLIMKRTSSTSNIIENKDSTVDKNVPARNGPEVRCSSVNERNPPLKKEPQKMEQKSRRTSSAPPQRQLGNTSSNRVQVNIVIDPSSPQGSEKINYLEKTDVDCKDSGSNRIDTASTKVSGRSVRSAPLKRRSRSAKRRFWGTGSCKNDEDGKPRNRSAGRGRNSIDSKAIDIVTMVSLVSSADSDSDTENSPGDVKLIDQLRSKLPTTSIIKTSINPTVNVARKPTKSVSFQRHSLDEDPPKEQQPSPKEEKKTTQARLAIVNHRGNGGTLSSDKTLPWRTDIPGLALPILALIHDAEENHDVPLTDREKRCLAVPIGDLHDKKRKLLKTRSIPSRPGMEKQTMSPKINVQESPNIAQQKIETPMQLAKTPASNSAANAKQTFATTSKEPVQNAQPMEPQFQTNKEKECWHLYRKMCDKGVCVSFDTVLRGMLTPTEYRLRQRELFQDS